MAKKRRSPTQEPTQLPALAINYEELLCGISDLLDQARRTAARTVNHLLTATYWDIGLRIVEFEQGDKVRAQYGETLLKRLAQDLTACHARGFGVVNLSQMRKFYHLWPRASILQTLSEKLPDATAGAPL